MLTLIYVFYLFWKYTNVIKKTCFEGSLYIQFYGLAGNTV